MINYIEIGRRIAKARKRKNLTQENLAELLDVSKEFISKIETGKEGPNLKRLGQLSALLDVPLEKLITGVVIESPHYLPERLAEAIDGMSAYNLNKLIEIAKTLNTN